MMILLLVLLLASTTIGLARAISSDGYGTHPGPRSHHDALDTGRRLI